MRECLFFSLNLVGYGEVTWPESEPHLGHFKTSLSSLLLKDKEADMFSLEGVSGIYCNCFPDNDVFWYVTHVSIA